MTYEQVMERIIELHVKSVYTTNIIHDDNFKWILSEDVLHTIESKLFDMIAYRNLINKRTLMGYPIERYEGKDKNVIRLVWEVE